MMKLLAALLFGLMISSVPISVSHADESRIIRKLDDLVETAAQKEMRQARKLEQQRQAERIANKSSDAVTVKKVVAPTPPPAPKVIPPRIEDRLLPSRPQKVESPLSAEKKALLEKVTGRDARKLGKADPPQISSPPTPPVWTSTASKTRVQNAFDHWRRHGPEFPEYANSKQYVEGARNITQTPPPGTLFKSRPNGDTMYYNPTTNTFSVKAADGAPRTMFRPNSGADYWNKQ
jgi:hypothetical protein